MIWHAVSRRLWFVPSLVGFVLVVLLFVKPELRLNEPFMWLCYLIMLVLLVQVVITWDRKIL